MMLRFLGHCLPIETEGIVFNFNCPQAGQAFTFFLQQKKVNKKCRRYRRTPKNHHIRLKSSNSLRSNNDDFLTANMMIFLTAFFRGG